MMHTLGQVAAVVICLDDAFRIVSVNVEGVQVCTDRLDWSEILELRDVRSARGSHNNV